MRTGSTTATSRGLCNASTSRRRCGRPQVSSGTVRTVHIAGVIDIVDTVVFSIHCWSVGDCGGGIRQGEPSAPGVLSLFFWLTLLVNVTVAIGEVVLSFRFLQHLFRFLDLQICVRLSVVGWWRVATTSATPPPLLLWLFPGLRPRVLGVLVCRQSAGGNLRVRHPDRTFYEYHQILDKLLQHPAGPVI